VIDRFCVSTSNNRPFCLDAGKISTGNEKPVKAGRCIGERQHSIERFWHNFLSFLEKSKIPKGTRRGYRKHVPMYIEAHRDLRLNQHATQVVGKSLNAKGRIKQVEERQFR
jgi:hypothetical protein